LLCPALLSALQPTDMREAVMRLLVSRNPRLLTLVNKENKSPMQFARSKQPKQILQVGWVERHAAFPCRFAAMC
jgi:hypothetical protein